MTTTDRDGLSAVQIARINRIELARYRKPPTPTNRSAILPAALFLLGIWFIICVAVILVQNHWSPGTELYTRLPNLNQQTPSITIYADQK